MRASGLLLLASMLAGCNYLDLRGANVTINTVAVGCDVTRGAHSEGQAEASELGAGPTDAAAAFLSSLASTVRCDGVELDVHAGESH